MSITVDIFVSSEEEPLPFARKLAATLGLELAERPPEGILASFGIDENSICAISVNEYGDFEDIISRDYEYHYRLKIYVYNWATFAESKKKALLNKGQVLFGQLKDTRQYPMILVDDLSFLVNEYHPDETNTP